MSKDKEIINKLFKVVSQQQQIITKIAQSMGEPAPATAPISDTMRASVEADIYDVIYGRGSRPQFGPKLQVHYAKLQQIPGGANLLVGLTVPPSLMAKWQSVKSSIEMALKNKYNTTSVSFRE